MLPSQDTLPTDDTEQRTRQHLGTQRITVLWKEGGREGEGGQGGGPARPRMEALCGSAVSQPFRRRWMPGLLSLAIEMCHPAPRPGAEPDTEQVPTLPFYKVAARTVPHRLLASWGSEPQPCRPENG